jgi:hypothetical protein
MLRREFLAVLAAAPFAKARTGADLIAALQASPYRDIEIEPPRTRIIDGGILIYENDPSRVMIFPKELRAIAVIKGQQFYCANFTFHGLMRWISYADNHTGFIAHSWRNAPFVIPHQARLPLTVAAFQRALRAAKRKQSAWCKVHPEFHAGMKFFSWIVSRTDFARIERMKDEDIGQ